ncbi:major facilitator family domain-containing protein [Cyclospora cayetanensis]|uniref:Major facilitator family domain-containing protein n=1 Tax=Cyclospora cayetanensis TaxID=88456 RepID=A0A1D3DAP9_9EIME|nr:major facilitator family domain-containing protein [Cyclospora cayetanensis]
MDALGTEKQQEPSVASYPTSHSLSHAEAATTPVAAAAQLEATADGRAAASTASRDSFYAAFPPTAEATLLSPVVESARTCSGPIFDMYIFLLGNHSNKWVGNTESLSGIVSLIVAAPAVCIVGLLASVLSFWGVSTNSFLLIIPSLILWGLFYEASNGATGAIFTDSLTRAGLLHFSCASFVLALWMNRDDAKCFDCALTTADGWFLQCLRSVPYIISISDFVRSMGAGMTVKFFPLFFSNDYNLSPIHLCLLSISYAFSVAIFIFFASTLSKHIGRALTSQLFSLLGLLALTAMCYLEDLRFLIAAHLLRGGMQNANYPLDRSMIVDFSKSSAFLGGILADKDYSEQTPPTESESARNMESASLTDSPPIENWDCPDDAPFWRSREGSNLSVKAPLRAEYEYPMKGKQHLQQAREPLLPDV